MNEKSSPVAHSVLRSAVLSLAPGLLILLFFILLAPVAEAHGLPPTLVLFSAIALVLVPVELGFLLVQGKRLHGRFSLQGVVLFRERIRGWQVALLGLGGFVWAGFCFGVIAPRVDPLVMNHVLPWLPGWFSFDDLTTNVGHYSKTALDVTIAIGFVFNGIVGPIVEEMYFRGYLLPRMQSTGRWAPLVNSVLFSLYHLFSPWQNVTRILAVVPFVYAVWWRRNISIGMVTHCILNTVGMILIFISIVNR